MNPRPAETWEAWTSGSERSKSFSQDRLRLVESELSGLPEAFVSIEGEGLTVRHPKHYIGTSDESNTVLSK